jgi:curli biogenesis system outer membrane secretion channel CsgG
MLAIAFVAPASAQNRRIAIYDFDSRTAEVSLRGRVPSAFNIGHQAAGQVMTRLVNAGQQFEVIERADIERILKEQGRKYDERFDPASAPELGRLLNVDGIVLGEVTSANASISDGAMRIPGTSRTVGGRTAKAKVHITARLISTQTGTIQVAQEADGDASQNISSSLTGVSQGKTGDDAMALSDALTKALAKAVAGVSTSIIAKAATLPQVNHPGAPLRPAGTPTGAPPIATAANRTAEPIINSVEGAKVYIEGGQEFKITPGERYDVRQVTRVLTLSNGQKQEYRERVETVVIDDVQGGLSVGHVEGGQASKAKPGDTLQKATGLPPVLQGPPPPAPARGGVPPKKFLPGNPR